MPILVDRRIATLIEAPVDVSAPFCEQGFLEIYASEHVRPGWHFAVFCYNPGLHADPADPNFRTTKHFRTTAHPMAVEGNRIILTRDHKSRYVFELRE